MRDADYFQTAANLETCQRNHCCTGFIASHVAQRLILRYSDYKVCSLQIISPILCTIWDVPVGIQVVMLENLDYCALLHNLADFEDFEDTQLQGTC